MEILKLKLTGTRPLLQHNGQLADPFNPFTRALKEATSAAKGKNKNDETLEAVRRAEWFGGLYLNTDGRVCMKEDSILACLTAGARKAKNGKLIETGVLCAEMDFPLEYAGPKDLEKLYTTPGFCDYRAVVVGQARVMRARPRFDKWAVSVSLVVDTELVDVNVVVKSFEVAGAQVGLGDFIPRFGRFEVSRA